MNVLRRFARAERCGLAVALLLLPVRAFAQLEPPASNPAGMRSTDGQVTTPDLDVATSSGAIHERSALAGAIDPKRYRLGPGDVLLLQAWGRVSRSFPLAVGPEGVVLVPGAGPISVEGRTLESAREMLLEKLRGQYRGVHLNISLIEPRRFRVYLSGEVTNSGPIEALASMRVSDVFTSGALKSTASRRRIEVLHRDGGQDIADLDRFLLTREERWNPDLQDGDVLRVPPVTQRVYVGGAVAQPGSFELGVADSLRLILRLAGDPLPAADGRLMLVSWRDAHVADSTWFSIGDVLAGRVDEAIGNESHLYLYFTPEYRVQHQAEVYGEISHPGVYPIIEGRTRLTDLMRSAGEFLPTADLASIRVHRRAIVPNDKDPELDRLLRLSRNELTASEYEQLRTKLAGLREDYLVDWNRLIADGDRLDILLRDGDLVRIERLVSSVRIDGEIRRPGILSWRAGMGIDDFVHQSGGFTDRAWRGKVRVTRAVTGQTLLARNVQTIDPGDFIWVPERPDITVWQQAKDVLGVLGGIATIVIAIRSVR